MERLTRLEPVTDPERVAVIVQDDYETYDHIIDGLQECVLLADPLLAECPIVSCSSAACQMTGYSKKQLIGQNCRILLQGVPTTAVSKSARKNITDYCSSCLIEGLSTISEIATLQPNARADGSHFVNFFVLSLIKVRHRIFIIGVQMEVGQGLFVRLSKAQQKEAMELSRSGLKRVREHLWANAPPLENPEPDVCSDQVTSSMRPQFKFYSERLQDHCMLMNDGYTAFRREPSDLGVNCLVFGDRPVRPDSNGTLGFTMRVDSVTPAFSGYPVLGFTRRRPRDEADLYPVVARCLGQSVLVGACGEAFARDQCDHYVMGFRAPPPEDVRVWALQGDIPPHKRAPPTQLRAGDLLSCAYTCEGRLQLMHNDRMILDFDVERTPEATEEYYAVIDVCFSASGLTLVRPSPCASNGYADELGSDEVAASPERVRQGSTSGLHARIDPESIKRDTNNRALELDGGARLRSSSQDSIRSSSASTWEDETHLHLSRQCTEVDGKLKTMVNEALVQSGIQKAIAKCKFMVTIADPRGKDCPLIAVSQEFETMTGFHRREILQQNCRFLNQGCDLSPTDLLDLRISSKTGAPFTAVLPNRKKSGELFLNLLDLRGLTVARNPETGEDMWFLIGVQADVTDIEKKSMPKDHIREVEEVCDAIRAGIVEELGKMALQGAAASGSSSEALDVQAGDGAWCLLETPKWRPGPNLGHRRRSAAGSSDAAPRLFAGDGSVRTKSREPDGAARAKSRDGSARARTRGRHGARDGEFNHWSTVAMTLPAAVLSIAAVQAWRRRGF